MKDLEHLTSRLARAVGRGFKTIIQKQTLNDHERQTAGRARQSQRHRGNFGGSTEVVWLVMTILPEAAEMALIADLLMIVVVEDVSLVICRNIHSRGDSHQQGHGKLGSSHVGTPALQATQQRWWELQ